MGVPLGVNSMDWCHSNYLVLGFLWWYQYFFRILCDTNGRERGNDRHALFFPAWRDSARTATWRARKWCLYSLTEQWESNSLALVRDNYSFDYSFEYCFKYSTASMSHTTSSTTSMSTSPTSTPKPPGPLPVSVTESASIGVGVSLFVLLLIAAFIFYLRWRHRQNSGTNTNAGAQFEKPELEAAQARQKEIVEAEAGEAGGLRHVIIQSHELEGTEFQVNCDWHLTLLKVAEYG
ncbi:uncharacterized protein K444DRAFT_663386 [Hyaloscypha bicolor E]|uniref:Uncharacterized protein n=1 Tax=Hyaloscypha bicolor E TaxID=1095630 RepID=A0A2J6TAY2_9HELO|nr:uncharacterized protein K444DRAFT_663386 [Hyaloscypha bicolor E]PMD60189.1 hypothetical protein K444DRAFT_663386 [Hyaloscypha bicolor E]